MDDIPNFYEGTEKLLEVWFEPLTSSNATNVKWLRTISRYCLFTCIRSCIINSTLKLWASHMHTHIILFDCITVYLLRSRWAEILELVQCEIVSVISGNEIDAYMLRYVHT